MSLHVAAPRGLRVRTLFLVAVVLAFAAASRGQLLISSDVTSLGGGVFQYDFTVENQGAVDLTLVSILNAPIDDSLLQSTLTAPTGFLSSYDSTLGVVDFLEGSDIFTAGSTKGLFQFQSSGRAGLFFDRFEALTVDAALITGRVQFSGDFVPIPEASTLWAASALMGFVALVARSRCFSPRAKGPMTTEGLS